MYEKDLHWENLNIQLGQFATFLDITDISVKKLFESLVNFGKNQGQKMFLPEVTKLAKLLLVLLGTNATIERSFLDETYSNVFKKYYKRKSIKSLHVITCSLQKD